MRLVGYEDHQYWDWGELTTNIRLVVIAMKNRGHFSRILYAISMMALALSVPSIFLNLSNSFQDVII